MAWTTYKSLDVPDTFDPAGNAGEKLTDDLKELADRAPYKADSAPGSGDDVNDGFSAGSTWLDTSTGYMWVCISASSGAAVWRTLYLRTAGALILCPGDGSSVSGQRGLQFDSGGNTRGTDAVDLQSKRTVSSQVASGDYGVISGGLENEVSGWGGAISGGHYNIADAGSFVGGGYHNVATGSWAVVSGGDRNLASGTSAFIGGGVRNNALGYRTVIGGGNQNYAIGNEAVVVGGSFNAGTYGGVVVGGLQNWSGAVGAFIGAGRYNSALNISSTVCGGGGYGFDQGNSASGYASFVGGGYANNASGSISMVIGGSHSTASLHGQMAHASGRFASNGDAQFTRAILRRATTNATATELTLDGSTPASGNRFTIDDEHSYSCFVRISARRDTGSDQAFFVRQLVIERTSGTVALEGSVQTVGTDINPAGWTISLTADNTNKSLKIEATGAASTNIRWVAVVEAIEIQYAN